MLSVLLKRYFKFRHAFVDNLKSGTFKLHVLSMFYSFSNAIVRVSMQGLF